MVARLGFKGTRDPIVKRRHMVGYLLELGFDLCIAPKSNVSWNPGFELPLGQYKRRRHPLLPLPPAETKAGDGAGDALAAIAAEL